MAKKITFDEAYEELMEIQSRLQNEDVSIEDISSLIKRSKSLITLCKDRLRGIEEDIDEAFKDE